MQKREFVYREILFRVLESGSNEFTQSALSRDLGVSLSIVNHALKPLKRMHAVKVNPRNFVVTDARKILFYWCSERNPLRDLVYSTRAEMPVREIERSVSQSAVFAAFSAFKFRFKSVPADYSEVYVYDSGAGELEKRFPLSRKKPNLFVLEKDSLMEKYGKTTTLAQTFADLWNLPQWYSAEFLKELELRINAVLE